MIFRWFGDHVGLILLKNQQILVPDGPQMGPKRPQQYPGGPQKCLKCLILQWHEIGVQKKCCRGPLGTAPWAPGGSKKGPFLVKKYYFWFKKSEKVFFLLPIDSVTAFSYFVVDLGTFFVKNRNGNLWYLWTMFDRRPKILLSGEVRSVSALPSRNTLFRFPKT